MQHYVRFLILAAVCLTAATAPAATVVVTDYLADGSGNEASAAANDNAFAIAGILAGDGGAIIVPAGVYYISQGLNWDAVNLTFRAEDPNVGAAIKRISTGSDAMLMLHARRGYVVEGLTLDGNRSTDEPAWSFGIRIDYGDDVLIKNCTIQNHPFDGILVMNNRYSATIDGCQILSNHRMGIAVTDANHGVVIKNCYFANNLAGVDFEPNHRHTGNHVVQNCTFVNNSLSNFGASFFPWDITIEDCNFTDAGSYIYAERTMNVVARNNIFSNGAYIKFNSGHGTNGDDGLGKIDLSGNTGLSGNGVNLLVNPGFDSWTGGDPDGWTVTVTGSHAIEQETQRVIEGGTAVHMTAAAGSAMLRQTLPVTANEHYTFGGYIQTDGQKHYSVADDPLIRLEFLDGGGVMVADVKLHGYYNNLDYGYYEKVMSIARAPVGAVQARISIGLDGGVSFEAYYDGLFFYHGIGPDGGDLTANQVRYRFDFEPPYRIYDNTNKDSRYTMVEYTHVDETDAYDAQVGYGFVSSGGLDSRRRSVTEHLLGVDFVSTPSQDDYFALDVPNGQYFVTFASGDGSYNTSIRMKIQGVTYGISGGAAMPAGAPLYVYNLSTGQTTSLEAWREGTDSQVMCNAGEVLYLYRQLVEVTNGQLTVASSGTNSRLHNWLEVVPAPSGQPGLTCADLVAAGENYTADINDDCYVDELDLIELTKWWLQCNDPNEPLCGVD